MAGPRAVPLRLGLGMAVFGSATPVSKIVTGAMPVFVASLLRAALGALVLAPFAWRRRAALRAFSRRDWMLVGLIAVFGMFGFSVLMLYGMRAVPGVVGATVMSTTPAVTAGASILFLGDAATWRKLAAVGLAVAGVAVLHLGGAADGGQGAGTDGAVLGSALVFGAVCCEAAYTLLGKRMIARHDPLLVAALAAALSLPLFLPFALYQWDAFAVSDVGTRAWIAAVWYGVGTLGLGSWLWYSGLAGAEGAVAAGFMGLMPASALILSYVLLGEPFRWLHIAGFGTVFAGVLLISWEHARMTRAG